MLVDAAVVERITRAINFQEPDRVPIWEALQNQEVYDHFAPGIPFPECAAISCEKLGIDATYGCMADVLDEGTDGATVRAARTVWDTKPRFRTLADLRSYDPGEPDEAELEERVLAHHERMQKLYGSHVLYLPQNGGWGFLPGYDTATFTVVAAAAVEDLPSLARFWDLNAERAVVRNGIIARHRLAPAVQCCEDVAYNKGLMVSPSMLRDHFFPRFQEVIAPFKEAGIKAIWHSDGNISQVLDDAIECGIDGINPIDPSSGMDIADLKRHYSRRLILVGNVGISHVLRFGTPEQVREDVRRCIRAASPGGGHILQCGDGQIMPDIPLNNVLAYIDEARKFGTYPTDLA